MLVNELANDSDPNSGGSIDPTTVKVGTGPSHGSVAVNASTGKITYTPTAGYSGPDSFTYTVKDNFGLTSNAATVSVTVTKPVTNLPPVAKDDSAFTKVNTPVVVDELANDSDPNSGGSIDPTTVKVASLPGNGGVSVDPVTGKITYTPKAGFTGSDSFTYTVKDKLGLTSNVATVTVQVTPPVTGQVLISHGWAITYPVGTALVDDGGSRLTLEKFAAFTNTASVDITFTQLSYDASPTITIADESATNVSGQTFSGLHFQTINTFTGNAAPAVFSGQSFNLNDPAQNAFTGQTITPNVITFLGTLADTNTAELGYGVDGGGVVINANPAKSGMKKVFTFAEVPLVARSFSSSAPLVANYVVRPNGSDFVPAVASTKKAKPSVLSSILE